MVPGRVVRDFSAAGLMKPSMSEGSGPGREDQNAIARFMSNCSIEATRPTQAEIIKLAGILPARSLVYLTAIPGRPLSELLLPAIALKRVGLTPVPHIAARLLPNLTELGVFLEHMTRDAGVRRVLLVGGDRADAVGSVPDSLFIIESGVLAAHGISSVSLPAFPDGHPHVSSEEIEISLLSKLAALQKQGLEGEIVTQFSFEAEPVLNWLTWLRERGVHAPVSLGLAGPTNLMKWLNYARRCGVRASAGALAARSGLVKQAFRAVAPDPIIKALALAESVRNDATIKPHLFSFGGLIETANWLSAVARGKFVMSQDGFDLVGSNPHRHQDV